jgi:hypothetical protein
MMLVLILASKVSAQTFGGGITITGTTNAPLVNNGSIPTNSFTLSFPAKQVTLSNVTSTNETAIFSYGIQLVGSSNIVLLASVTNTFSLPNGTNNGTWITNIPQQALTFQIVPYAQANIGANTNGIFVP